MVRALPTFADLMLLPPLIAKDSRVFIKGSVLAVKTAQPEVLKRELEVYPHVSVVVDNDGHVQIRSQDAPTQRYLLVWPSGRQLGVLMWERCYYSVVPAETMQSWTAAGQAITVVRCEDGSSVVQILDGLVDRRD